VPINTEIGSTIQMIGQPAVYIQQCMFDLVLIMVAAAFVAVLVAALAAAGNIEFAQI
jgi:hypothetical protein